MTDKYPKLRQDLAAAIADAKRQGGVNERAEQIAALLAERDALAAAPVSAEPMVVPKCPFHCGWDGLHKIAVQDAAYLAKVQWPEDEEGVSVPRATAMRSMDYLIQVCRTMLNAAPVAAQPNVKQQTLDDVIAGIPARDAEITALRKEVETLQAQLVDRSPEMQGTPVDESPNLQSQQQPVSGADGLPIELRGISEAIGNGDGIWRSCSGCHELNEGMATGPFSKTFKCHLGVGCAECGGIGAIWDTTDYDAMGDFMATEYQQRTENTEPVGQDQLRDAVQIIEPSGNTGELPELPDIAPTDDWDSVLDCIKKYGVDCYQAALQNRPQNIPEIIPEPAQRLIFPTMLRKMWSGSEVQAWLDDELAKLTKLSSQQDADKVDVWQCTTTLPESDDLIWLYCQDTNTIDGPVKPNPEFIDAWTHWAWVTHPSTTAIDAARKEQA